MNRAWLSLLLIMPMAGVAEEAAPVLPAATPMTVESPPTTAILPGDIAGGSTSVASSASARPTLVEKLKAQEPTTPRHPTPDWGNMLLGLGAVLAMIFGLAWLTKRLRVRVPGMAEQMKIVETVNLGPREKLCIVVVDGKRLLLGVTQHSISVLNSSEDTTKKDESEAMFSEKIKKMLQNGTPNGR